MGEQTHIIELNKHDLQSLLDGDLVAYEIYSERVVIHAKKSARDFVDESPDGGDTE